MSAHCASDTTLLRAARETSISSPPPLSAVEIPLDINRSSRKAQGWRQLATRHLPCCKIVFPRASPSRRPSHLTAFGFLASSNPGSCNYMIVIVSLILQNQFITTWSYGYGTGSRFVRPRARILLLAFV